MSTTQFSLRPGGQVIVTGSLAFDQIMVFPGSFKDHINPDKLHVISISFLVKEMRKQRGGCAGNIGYTLALLGHDARLVAAAGEDFAAYRAWLEEQGIDMGGVRCFEGEMTASCHITTDQDDNQITGFFVGAMARAGELSLTELAGDRPAVAIIAPDDPGAMMRHCQEARDMQLPFLFDPSFQVIAMTGEDLAEASRGASIIAVNDYEHSVFEEKTGKKGAEIFDLVEMAVVTLGGEGSKILRSGAEEIHIPVAKVDQFVDPTGAGDSYRGGFIAGLQRGYDLSICGRMGSVASAFVVEQNGTQNQKYTKQEFAERYAANFGPLPASDRLDDK